MINIVFIDHLHMAYYGKLIKKDFPQIKLLLMEHNVEYIFWKRIFENEKNIFKKIFFWVQSKKVFIYEKNIVDIMDRCLTVSSNDEKYIQKLNSNVKTFTIPVAIDIQKFNLSKDIQVIPHSCIILGNFGWLPNMNGCLWFLKYVWPIIKKDFTDSKLFVVGKNPSNEMIKFQKNDGSVSIVGYVEDVKPWIGKAEIFIVPIFEGGGIRIKILEAMAVGKPIISTSIGAEGIAIENMRNIIIADNVDEFVKSIRLLFQNKKFQKDLSRNAKLTIKKIYSADVIGQNLNRLISNLFQNNL